MIILEPLGGLCNRMRAVNSAISLSRNLEIPLCVIWKNRRELCCPMSMLFNIPKSITVIEGLKAKILGIALERTADVILGQSEVNSLMNDPSQIENLANSNSLVYFKTCSSFYSYQHFDSFQPVTFMAETISKYTDQFRGKHVVGVHIRRTDNEKSIMKSKTDDFIELMHREVQSNPNTIFFLATDSPIEDQRLVNVFGDRVIRHKKSLKRNSVKGIQDALIDLMCLAHTDKLFGSYWSSFSDVAAEINDIEKIIVES